MLEGSFHLDWIQWLLEHRTGPATVLFQLFTFLGDVEGYVLVVALIHAVYDKKLALRLAVVALVAMSLNHLLKTLVANPRPFIQEGTYAEKWAVSSAKAKTLATEYSTPSGHGMAGSAFYGYLYARVSRRPARIAAIAALLLTGLSRPYLGVHYVEDVVLGWALGLPLALLAVGCGEAVADAAKRVSPLLLFCAVGAVSAVLWRATSSVYAGTTQGPPLAFLSYTGFLAGIVLAYPLEARWVGFDPRSSTAARKLLRYAISLALVLGSLLLLDEAFGRLATDASPLGQVLRYLRYAAASGAGFLLGPVLFVRLRLAETA